MITLLLVLFTAVLYGMIEAVVYDHGFQPPDDKKLFGWFSPSYHIPAATLWFLICCLGGQPELFFTYCFVEDLSYFVFSPKDSLDDEDWVNWKLGGFYLSDLVPGLFPSLAGFPNTKAGYMPWTYVILNALTIILYLI